MSVKITNRAKFIRSLILLGAVLAGVLYLPFAWFDHEQQATAKKLFAENARRGMEAQAAKKRSDDELVALCKRIGHLNLGPTDTSEASLNRALQQEGMSKSDTTRNAISLSWLNGAVAAQYYAPRHTKRQPAAYLTLSVTEQFRSRLSEHAAGSLIDESLPRPRPDTDILDVSFAALRPGVTEDDFEAELRRGGPVKALYGGWNLPNGWYVLRTVAKGTNVIESLTFCNPNYASLPN